MKLLKNFDAKKIANAKNKILLAIVSILFFALLFLSSAFREFVSKHPGLIGVLISVSGEVYFDWKEESGKHAKWKKFFMALLVVSLSYELYEASESDQKAADSIKLAGQANERAANTESNNLILRSNVAALELKLQPRRITAKQKKDFIEYSKKFTLKSPVAICIASDDSETKVYAQQLRELLDAAGYGNGHEITKIDVFISLPIDLPTFASEEARDLPFIFIFYGEEGQNVNWGKFQLKLYNGGSIFSYFPDDPKSVPGFLDEAFLKIGIKPACAEWTNFPTISKSGDWTIFVPQKF